VTEDERDVLRARYFAYRDAVTTDEPDSPAVLEATAQLREVWVARVAAAKEAERVLLEAIAAKKAEGSK
jgi:hypothetical protein